MGYLFKPSERLIHFQLSLFQENVEKQDGQVTFSHRFLVEITMKHRTFYLKINTLDNEFYFFSDNGEIHVFREIQEFEDFFFDLFRKEKNEQIEHIS